MGGKEGEGRGGEGGESKVPSSELLASLVLDAASRLSPHQVFLALKTFSIFRERERDSQGRSLSARQPCSLRRV